MSTRKRKQDEEDEEELQALPSDVDDEEEEYVPFSGVYFLCFALSQLALSSRLLWPSFIQPCTHSFVVLVALP